MVGVKWFRGSVRLVPILFVPVAASAQLTGSIVPVAMPPLIRFAPIGSPRSSTRVRGAALV